MTAYSSVCISRLPHHICQQRKPSIRQLCLKVGKVCPSYWLSLHTHPHTYGHTPKHIRTSPSLLQISVTQADRQTHTHTHTHTQRERKRRSAKEKEISTEVFYALQLRIKLLLCLRTGLYLILWTHCIMHDLQSMKPLSTLYFTMKMVSMNSLMAYANRSQTKVSYKRPFISLHEPFQRS